MMARQSSPVGGYSEEFLISKGKQRPLYEVGGKCNCSTCLAGGCCHPTMSCSASKKNSPILFNAVEERRKTQTQFISLPSNQIWMFTLPVLVLAVVLIGGRK